MTVQSVLSAQVSVPRFAVGIIIGRNGEMIKKIQNDAGVRIQFRQGKKQKRVFSSLQQPVDQIPARHCTPQAISAHCKFEVTRSDGGQVIPATVIHLHTHTKTHSDTGFVNV